MYQQVKKSFFLIFLLIILIGTVDSLVLNHQQQNLSLLDQQYQKLQQQQKYLQNNVNTLVDDMSSLQKNVSQSTNGSQKVILLESAILSQRDKAFNIRNQIIPPFSLTKSACLQLTNQQKIDMLSRIKSTKTQITQLQKQVVNAPKCDKITSIQKDIQKQLTLLNSLEKIITTQCQSTSILTPTIYQTNIYSNGWILGDQDIDDLVQQYYQRNIRYHNITNCPLQKPFFNGQQCIFCNQSTPVFNILTRVCTSCPQDQQADSNLRKCAWVDHFTNWTSVSNWMADGTSPTPKPNATPCPVQKPYYDGKHCNACLMPNYWSINKNSCLTCDVPKIFDVNNRQCQISLNKQLSILQGTRWVTNDCNVTRIIQERVNLLQLNATTKDYKYCPNEKPYFDGITCVNCPNEFNVDSRICVSSPNKPTLYNQNMRCYLQKQTGFQTDPLSSNYTSKSPLSDSSTPNCLPPRPYYDSTACIACLQPFPIFNVQTKRCTACDSTQIYNKTQHKCIKRATFYISTNQNRLMATPEKSISQYIDDIKHIVKDNPDAVVLLCKDMEYSNFNNCLNCTKQQYFNVQTKQCQLCDGVLNQTTQVCISKAYYYTNLNPNSTLRIVSLNKTIDQQKANIKNLMSLHNDSKLCPVQKPYVINNLCSNCTRQSFNYTSSQCVQMICLNSSAPFYNNITDKCQPCSATKRYNTAIGKCSPLRYVTNTNAIYFYIEQDNYTKNALDNEAFNLTKANVVVPCEPSHPYSNGTNCIDCPISRNINDAANQKPYFNLKTLKCQACPSYNNLTHQCPSDNITCPDNAFLNPDTNECSVWVTNIDALRQVPYIEQQNATYANLSKSIQQIKTERSTINCPVETPVFSFADKKCVLCQDPTPYFNLFTQACQDCPNYNQTTNTCQEQIPRFKMNVEDFYGTIFG